MVLSSVFFYFIAESSTKTGIAFTCVFFPIFNTLSLATAWICLIYWTCSWRMWIFYNTTWLYVWCLWSNEWKNSGFILIVHLGCIRHGAYVLVGFCDIHCLLRNYKCSLVSIDSVSLCNYENYRHWNIFGRMRKDLN